MNAILDQIEKIGIVPVIKIDNADRAIRLVKSLITGGLPCAEITFRTSQAEDSIRRIKESGLNVLLGAGTVLSIAQVDRALEAGAQFIVTPSFNPKVVQYCLNRGITIIPGCSKPSDVEQATLDFGLEVVKFFPAEQSGGLEYVKAIAGPYNTLKFLPTGGINVNNVGSYLRFKRILACGGSWMAKDSLINDGEFDRITALCREAVLKMLDFSVIHLGINTSQEEEVSLAARCFSSYFGFPIKERSASVFTGSSIEIMKSKGLGTHGHIAISTNSVKRAMALLERQGVVFDMDSARVDADGDINFIYLKDEIAGFAVHLLERT
ncbi:MAG: bifunctional 4-hydroxy-2-oxoglutarate aldolase/2-dehydro-3-deoxy-phosphogluconate aldolase [Treponema sp.]|jgi:2-dehydro-3-deoxyphosphogluconate aldolase/(4S)-4-hydroxy-2-oxoglutarate aldolase|nr:bifunctional 4-hydroxy-2-oxoglutarate aldolase/2-dehydro-3-deoxy-phosphogluconate aldolase [Treponema sp.]